ncbi:MAG: polysaccharide deacetylase family protein [Bacteroidales bacterium]|jgi:hypothetical protein|nr:polysaccharide deacetylase family protein [Bacteroidales bacterium]
MIIYVDKLTARVDYILDLMLNGLVGANIKFTTNKQDFIESPQEKLSYTKSKICNEVFVPQNSDLLYEIGIIKQQEVITNSQDPAFDLFASAFFFASRYEEYVDKDLDKFGRYFHTSSLAYKRNILHLPIINLWAEELKCRIRATYPNIELRERHFKFINSVDVDMAWRYKGLGFARTVASFCFDLLQRRSIRDFRRRINVIRGKEKDPLATFDFMLKVGREQKTETIFFLQVGNYGRYDKNSSIKNRKFRRLIHYFYNSYLIGIHPSYNSNSVVHRVRKEVKRLLSVVGKDHISRSRFHYLRFRLPKSYNTLLECHISDDYSMGYSRATGFRSGLCTPHRFYDLTAEKKKPLTIHPFAVMDATLRYTTGTEKAFEVIKRQMDIVKSVNGEFISIFHNQNLCEEDDWIGWRDIYTKTLAYATEISETCKKEASNQRETLPEEDETSQNYNDIW